LKETVTQTEMLKVRALLADDWEQLLWINLQTKQATFFSTGAEIEASKALFKQTVEKREAEIVVDS